MKKVKQTEKKLLWSKEKGCMITTAYDTFASLDAGYYHISANDSIGLYFLPADIETNKLFQLPNETSDKILDDIQKFWTLEDTYKRYGKIYRRNYLIYSAPGTGKSSLIKMMCKQLIEEHNGIVFSLGNEQELMLYPEAIRRVRKIEPDRKVITIIEDIDTFMSNSYSYSSDSINSKLLNILDGDLTTNNVVTIATTNYIDRIEPRYKNRPSRFDMVMEFPLPNEACRKMFIEKSVFPEDLKKINIAEWVKKTKGYRIDHLNELILLFFVFGHTEEESFERIDKMVKNNDSLQNETSSNKKKIGDLFSNDVIKYNEEYPAEISEPKIKRIRY